MKYLKLTTAMLAVISLSGCLGGGGSDTVTKAPDATYSEKFDSAYALLATIDDKVEESELTSDFELPTTGTANYTGYMALPDPSDDGSILGTGEIDVDFENFDVTGTVGNFTNDMDQAWSGNLSFNGNFWVEVVVEGTLISETGVETIIEAEAELAHHTNYGSTAGGEQTPEYYTGNLIGEATTDGDMVKLDDSNTAYIGELTN